MKMKVFALICIFYGIFAMDSEKELKYREGIKNLKETVESLQNALFRKECKIKSLELELKCDRVQKSIDHKENNHIAENLYTSQESACYASTRKSCMLCRLCNGAILVGQLHMKSSSTAAHAICQAGFQGYKCTYYEIEDRPWYTGFQKRLLKVFENAGSRFIHLQSTYIEKQLIIQGYDSKLISEEGRNNSFKTDLRKLNADVAHWRDKYHGSDWYIHRKFYGEPEDVNWKRYIIEILKTENVLPLVDFDYKYDRTQGKMIVPPKLLNFIQQYTKASTFADALMTHVPEVEVYNVSGGKYYMRLKRPETLSKFSTPTDSKSSQTEWSAYDSAQNCKPFIPFKSPSCEDSSNFMYDPENEYNFENVHNPVTKTGYVSQSTNCAKNFKHGFDFLRQYQEYQSEKLVPRVPTNRYQEDSPTNFFDYSNFFYNPTNWYQEQSSSGDDFQEYQSDKLAPRVPTNRYQEDIPTSFYSPTNFFDPSNFFSIPTNWCPEQSSSGDDFQKTKSSSGENSQNTNRLLSLQSQKEKADLKDPIEFKENQFKE